MRPSWEIAFWSRISRLVAAVVVCVFAVPFAFGPLRSAGAGARTVLGIMAGVLFVLLTQTLENSGQVYGLNPLMVAWGPTLLLSLVSAGRDLADALAATQQLATRLARSRRLRPARIEWNPREIERRAAQSLRQHLRRPMQSRLRPSQGTRRPDRRDPHASAGAEQRTGRALRPS